MEEDKKIMENPKREEWNTPSFQIIPFKNTKTGTDESIEETLGGGMGTVS